MHKKKTLLILVLAFTVLLGGAYILYNQLGQEQLPDQLAGLPTQSTQSAPTVPEQTGSAAQPTTTAPETITAPDFTVYDKDGNPVKLSDYFGKPIVLNFWASWCGPCQMEMPDFHEKYLQLGDRVHFLMVNMTAGRETKASASAFIQENGYTFPVLYDTASDAAATYVVYSLPTTYFIDAQGNAIGKVTGAISADTLQKGIDLILPKA